MRKFWGFYDNEKYRVGCDGQTIYVYNQQDVELAKFRDIDYAYHGAFQPGTNIFAAKSTTGKLAVYDLDKLALITKFRFGCDGAQDHGFAFTPDGKEFYNILYMPSLQTKLTIYDTVDFSLKETLFADRKDLHLDEIEFDADAGEWYILGYTRGSQGCYNFGFIGRLADGTIADMKRMDRQRYDYLKDYKTWQRTGFTEKAYQWSGLKLAGYEPIIHKISLRDEYELL